MGGPHPGFDAFISYGHAADGKLAPALQTGLQRFARPWHKRRALRVFRDDTGLSVNPDLWGSIRAALDDAEWCILLASPQAAQSVWVNQELEHWLATRPQGRILPVLTEGTLVWDPARSAFDPERSTALPRALQGYFEAEPRHLDLTWARDETQLDLRHARFRDAIADLAAPIHGVAKDELESEDVRQHRRAVRVRRASFAGLAVLLVLALTAVGVAVGQRNRAQHEARVSDSQRLAIQAQTLTGSQLDRALLLSVAALDLDDSTASRQGVLAALGAQPQLEAFDHRFGSTLGAMGKAPDRQGFVVGDQDGTMRTWDGADAIGPRVQAGVGSLLDVVYAPDGRRVAVSGDRGARLFDAQLRPAGPLLRTRGASEWIAMSPDGALLATSGSSGIVQLWRVRNGQQATPPIRVSPARATGAVFDTSGHTLWVGAYEGTIRAVDTRTGRLLGGAIRLSRTKSTYALALSPDGRTLAASVDSGAVFLVDTRTRQMLGAPLRFHESEPYALAFNTDGSLLASADDDGAIAVWRPRAGTLPLYTLRGHGELVSDLAFTSSRRLMSLAGGELARWNLDGEALGYRRAAGTGPLGPVAHRPKSTHFVAIGLRSGRMTAWSSVGKDPRRRPLVTGLARVTAAQWTPDGKTLLVGGGRRASTFRYDSRQGVVLSYDASGLAVSAPLAIGAVGVRSLDVSPNGRLLAIGDTSGRVGIWDLRTRSRVAAYLRPDPDETGVNAVAFSPDSRTLAAGGNAGVIATWRVQDGVRLWSRGTGANVAGVAWALNGATVVAGNGLSKLIRLRGDTGRVIGSPTAAGVGEITSTAVSPDGRLAAVVGRLGSVAVVDVTSGDRLYLFGGRPAAFSNLTFLSSRLLASVSTDGDVVLRHLDPAWWGRRACEEAARPLNREEKRTYLPGLDLQVC